MITINLSQLNWLAILVAALATFMLGGAWYTALFGKAWQKAQGYSDEQCRQLQAAKPPAMFFGTMIVCYFIVALAIALLIQMAGIHTAGGGAMLGFIVWLLCAAIGLTNHIPTHVAFAGYGINTAYQLLYLVGCGVLLGAWQ